MGRMYRLSKEISQNESKEILREINEVKEVEWAGFTPDGNCLVVKTSESNYPEVMSKAVNICKRVAEGLEISFVGFEVLDDTTGKEVQLW